MCPQGFCPIGIMSVGDSIPLRTHILAIFRSPLRYSLADRCLGDGLCLWGRRVLRAIVLSNDSLTAHRRFIGRSGAGARGVGRSGAGAFASMGDLRAVLVCQRAPILSESPYKKWTPVKTKTADHQSDQTRLCTQAANAFKSCDQKTFTPSSVRR